MAHMDLPLEVQHLRIFEVSFERLPQMGRVARAVFACPTPLLCTVDDDSRSFVSPGISILQPQQQSAQ
jgi:hypothetical protein